MAASIILMGNVSAGLLMYRRERSHVEYFLVHPGGPYFKNKNAKFWTIPKGLAEADEELLEAAKREFLEETGIQPSGPFEPLGTITQKSGKIVHAWSFAGSWDSEQGIDCNTFTMEWPPRSGRHLEFPEVDKAQWFDYESALAMIIPEQAPFIYRIREMLSILK